jgi:hypothetical protein
MRRFPPPWTVERLPSGFKVIDANGQSLAYFYARENDHDANTAGVLTMDEARRMASNFANLPELTVRRPRLTVTDDAVSLHLLSGVSESYCVPANAAIPLKSNAQNVIGCTAIFAQREGSQTHYETAVFTMFHFVDPDLMALRGVPVSLSSMPFFKASRPRISA